MASFFRHLDESVFRFVNQTLAHPVGDFLFPIFNHAAPFLPLFALLLLWLVHRNARRLWITALTCVIALILADALVTNPLKKTIRRPRPAATLSGVREMAAGATGGYAFPSSHTVNAFLIATILAGSFPRKRNFVLFFGIAALIAFSRAYVGVHYPSDVAGSALLGFGLGFGAFLLSRHFEKAFPEGRPSRAPNPWIPIALLVGIQAARLAWTCFNQLDVPVECARWLCAVYISPTDAPTLMRMAGKIWFSIFGASRLSLWAIPWTWQTLLVAGLAWRAWKSGRDTLWGVVFVSTALPLISQLSILGSPGQIFQNADWPVTLPVVTFYFYLILGLPLWIFTIWNFTQTPWRSLSALTGWVLGFCFPSLWWWIPLLLSLGTIDQIIQTLRRALPAFSNPSAGWSRVALVACVGYGVLTSLAVYNPRLLRKLDLSILPRNDPQYIQIGWSDWYARQHRWASHEIWTDSALSKYSVQYRVGRKFTVKSAEDFAGHPKLPPGGVLYVREVDFAQIHPKLIFVPHDAWIPAAWRRNWKEQDSFEVFRQGDPIRQFQLFYISDMTH